MNAAFIILILLPLAMILDTSEDKLIPKNYTFYDNVCIMELCDIHIYFVPSWEDYPVEFCQNKNIRGCSVYGENTDNYIYMRPQNYNDRWGMSTFQHEALHILCQCDFHMTSELRNLLDDEEDVFSFVLEYKESIRKYQRGFI